MFCVYSKLCRKNVIWNNCTTEINYPYNQLFENILSDML